MNTYRYPSVDVPTIAPGHSPLVNRLLHVRGVVDADVFLAPNYEDHLHDPMLLNDMEKAVDRVKVAMEAHEQIAIFSDYDCDGIPGAVVLHDYFKAIGYEQFQNYIPHRHYEGFGLSCQAIDKLADQRVTLVITIDCGTSDTEAIAYANEKGIDVIVTDHHVPGDVLPEAYAIVNPKLGTYPFTELCGAAVVFKLAQALLKNTNHALPVGQEKWWLDMVGIATIADMVPLIGENRVLAHYGLQVLRKSRRPGLQKLLYKNKVDQRYLTEEDIGFTIGPRINAASRMDSPEIAFKMLTATDEVEAGVCVDSLEKLNQERKTAVAQMTKEINKRLEHLEEIPPVLVMGNPEWRPALVGLAANKLAEEYLRPVFLWGKDGNGVYKGSCRSGGEASVVTLMNAVPEIFIEHGGHHASGGFAVKDEFIFSFAEKLNEAFVSLGTKAFVQSEKLIDEVLTLDVVTLSLVKDLALLAPYGTGNRKPLFSFNNVTPRKVEQFGKAKEHLKLIFETNSGTLEAIAFFSTSTTFQKNLEENSSFNLIAHVEQTYFMGRPQLRLRVVDAI